MWRAFFLAVGIYCCTLGVECLAIERAVMKPKQTSQQTTFGAPNVESREIVPPEWAPWTLLSTGAVLMIYSFTIPKRVNG